MKKIMSMKKCISIFAPISAVTLAIAIMVPIFSDMFKTTLNTMFGEGELKTENIGNVNSKYYNKIDAGESVKKRC